MPIVYSANNSVEADVVVSFLESKGIQSSVVFPVSNLGTSLFQVVTPDELSPKVLLDLEIYLEEFSSKSPTTQALSHDQNVAYEALNTIGAMEGLVLSIL